MAVATIRPNTTIDSSLNMSSTFHNTGIRDGNFHIGHADSHTGNRNVVVSGLVPGIRLVAAVRVAEVRVVVVDDAGIETAGAIRSSTNRVKIQANIPGRRRWGDVPPPIMTDR